MVFSLNPLKYKESVDKGTLAPYIFLLCAEIVTILIKNNENIKCNVINNEECRLS